MHQFGKVMCNKRNVVSLILIEIFFTFLYSAISIMTYTPQELCFEENDMYLRNQDGSVTEGNYLDVSFVDSNTVVTPAFQLQKGIYYLEASYISHGIVKAGLIYDISRKGKDLVDDDEFVINSEEQTISYRIKIRDDSRIRFKIRLTGDAVEGDYLLLSQVHIISSKATYVYRIFCLVSFLFVVDFLVWGYIRYYTKWGVERRIIFSVLAITSFVLGLPLYRNGLSSSKDLTFHLSRLEGVYRSLGVWGRGQFPVRIQSGWLDGYGYAVSIFYGDILMYFPALLRTVGFTLEEAYKIYAESVNIATVFLSFYVFKKMTKKEFSAMVGSVLYAGSTHRLSMLYGAMVGTASSMIFYPLIATGFYLLFTEDTKSEKYKRIWIFLAIGFTGILMTHMISCLIIGVYSFLLCIIMLKKVLRRNTLYELLKAASMSALLSLWYLIPLLQYMLNEKLRINSSIVSEMSIDDYYAALAPYTQEAKSLYSLFTDYGAIGFSLLLVVLLYIVTISIQGKSRLTKQCMVLGLFTLFAFVVCLDLFPTVRLAKMSRLLTKFFMIVQYQDRLMSVAIVMASCFVVLFFSMDIFTLEKLYVMAGVLCCITLWCNLCYFETLSNDLRYLDGIELESRTDNDIYSYNVGNGEYLPTVTSTQNLTKEVQGDEILQIDYVERDGLSFNIEVHNMSSEEGVLLLPLLYYGGYQARDSVNHEKLKVGIGDNGRIAVTIPPNYHGAFHLGFYEPILWRIAEVISALTLIAFITMVGGMKYRSKFSWLKRRRQY